ncbi:MAG: DUF3494 domain-containing protein [Dehalococcoidia bacterium]|nr:MAG: DUF3494 domain-containing protein [Dehalococcoidia bacterium]
MKSKTGLILLTFIVLIFLAYSGTGTSGSFINEKNSTDNVLRIKDAPLFGSADNFTVLAYSTVTNSGATAITGDIGVSPGTSVIGFPPGTVNGTIHVADAAAAQAQLDVTIAYNDAAGRIPTAPDEVTLGGRTLAAGVYHGGTLSLTGTLTLTGDANAVWIFQAESTLDTADGSQIVLSGDAKAANVYWKVGSSATLGANSTFKGNIMAYASITVNSGANLEGRVLAQTGAVTLNANTITKPNP